jgi:hypothetical protein
MLGFFNTASLAQFHSHVTKSSTQNLVRENLFANLGMKSEFTWLKQCDSVCVCVCVCVCVYIYIYIEREREREAYL